MHALRAICPATEGAAPPCPWPTHSVANVEWAAVSRLGKLGGATPSSIMAGIPMCRCMAVGGMVSTPGAESWAPAAGGVAPTSGAAGGFPASVSTLACAGGRAA